MTDSVNVETPKSGRGFAITSLVLGILAAVLVYPTPKIPLEDTKHNAVFFVALSLAFGLASFLQSRKPKGMAVAGVLLAACSGLFLALNWSGASKTAPAVSQAPKPPISNPIAEPSPVAKSSAESEWTPSYDCQKVASGPERMICSNKELSNLDVQLNDVYAQAAKRVTDRSVLKTEQLAWLKNVRNRCSDADCMKHAYGLRLVELRAK
jgi:hypothetical protein